MSPPVDLDWLEAVSIDEFRGIVLRYEPHRLRRLRDALIDKAVAINEQLVEAPTRKQKRDGSYYSASEYQRWRESAEGARNCTEHQIDVCNAVLHGRTMPPREVLEILVRVCAEVEKPAPDEIAAVRIARHYLKGDAA